MLAIVLSCLTISLALAGIGALIAKFRGANWKRWFCGVWCGCFLMLLLLSIMYFSFSSGPIVHKS